MHPSRDYCQYYTSVKMAFFNVDRNNPDTFYRYKMPKVETKYEGRGNGTKTVIVNMEALGKALNRPNELIHKSFGLGLGTQARRDKIGHGRYIINGIHTSERLHEVLDALVIKNLVLCSNCSNPETELHVSKTKNIYMGCRACGSKSKLTCLSAKMTSLIQKIKYTPFRIKKTEAKYNIL